MRCLHVSSYMCVISFRIRMVLVVMETSFFMLHSLMDMRVYGIIVGDGMNLGSLGCVGIICIFTMLL